MNRKVRLLALGLILGAQLVIAGEPPVRIEQGWVRAVPPASADSVAYMTLVNTSDKSLRLTGGNTPVAEMVMPMTVTTRLVDGHEVSGMKTVPAFEIPAHGQLPLTPEGDHLMLMNLKEHARPGATVRLTLHFEPGGIEITKDLPVAFNQP